MKKILLPLSLALVVAFHLPVAAQIIGRPAVSAVPSGPGAVGPALNFTLSPQQLQQNYQTATAKLDSALAAIAAVPPGAVTFANTVKAYEEATAAWQREMYPIGFLTAVAVDPVQRAAAAELEDQMETYGVALGHRDDLYQQFERAVAKGEKLSAIDARLLDDTVKSFRENGFALPAAQREKLKAMQERLGHLGNAFGRNIAESKDWLEVGPEGLKGLPEDYVSGLERTEDGKYKIALNESSYVTYMRFAESAESRKSLLVKWQSRAAEPNLPILKEALGLRRDIAQLLGYKSYPEMSLKDRMAGTPEKVFAFINRLKDVVLSRARADLAELLEIKRRIEPAAAQVFAWETGYLSNILRQERYDLDTEKVKEYFPVDRVVEGTMKVYQKTLGLSFREMTDGPRWHPDVRLIAISDAATGRLIGHFYLDLYPRDGKYTHAAAFTIIKGRLLEDGTYEQPTSAMVANFPKAAPGKPALMPHSEVETFFHEFGHLMHQTLTTAQYASYSGSSVARDFVEAPSQMLENFVWERNVLDELSGHFQDGAKLPDDLYKKMLAARSFQDGLGYATQLAYGMGDMVLHTLVPDAVSEAFNKVMEEFTGIPAVAGTNRVASFGHLMGGYGAGYYGYLWSKVYAQDIYTVFKAAGVVSPEVGARYRREILEVGSSRPELDSLRAFLGREPSEEAFMREVRGVPVDRVVGPITLRGELDPQVVLRLSEGLLKRAAELGGVKDLQIVVEDHHEGNPLVTVLVPSRGARTMFYLHELADFHRTVRYGRFDLRHWLPRSASFPLDMVHHGELLADYALAVAKRVAAAEAAATPQAKAQRAYDLRLMTVTAGAFLGLLAGFGVIALLPAYAGWAPLGFYLGAGAAAWYARRRFPGA